MQQAFKFRSPAISLLANYGLPRLVFAFEVDLPPVAVGCNRDPAVHLDIVPLVYDMKHPGDALLLRVLAHTAARTRTDRLDSQDLFPLGSFQSILVNTLFLAAVFKQRRVCRADIYH